MRRHSPNQRVDMTLNKRMRDEMLAHCGEIHDDDGVDPRDFFRSNTHRDKNNYKATQLCKQVAETLSLVLTGEFDDELLQSLHVVSVDPAPDASQLAVTLRADIGGGQFDSQEILSRLTAVTGRLRAEVASAITRKRAPKLLFRLTGPVESEEVEP